MGSYRNGWIVLSDGVSPIFIYQSLRGPRTLPLPKITQVDVRRGIWTDTVEINHGNGAACTMFLLKDGPPAHIALAEIRGAIE